jgi:hypothetical protein
MTIWWKKLPVKWTFDQMTFRSNELSVIWLVFLIKLSVIWLVFLIKLSVKWPFSKYFRSNDLLINFVFGQMTFFGKMNIRSNGLRLNGDSVKCTFGQMAFGETVFSQMVFCLSTKKNRLNDFSLKSSRTGKSFILQQSRVSNFYSAPTVLFSNKKCGTLSVKFLEVQRKTYHQSSMFPYNFCVQFYTTSTSTFLTKREYNALTFYIFLRQRLLQGIKTILFEFGKMAIFCIFLEHIFKKMGSTEIVVSSVRLSVRPSVRPSVRLLFLSRYST